ncbi:MAG: arylesterase [Aeromonas sp.]
MGTSLIKLITLWGRRSALVWLSLLPLWAQAANLPTWLILGDSLSAGYQMPAEKSWPALLDKRWQAAGLGRVINASISGETTQGGLARLPALLAQHQPSAVLIELGANDGLRGQPTAAMQANLAQMIALAKAQGAQVVLTQIKLPRNYGARYGRQFEQVFTDLAAASMLPLLPFFIEPLLNRPELMLPDGLHPTAAAQPLIAEQVASFLATLAPH